MKKILLISLLLPSLVLGAKNYNNSVILHFVEGKDPTVLTLDVAGLNQAGVWQYSQITSCYAQNNYSTDFSLESNKISQLSINEVYYHPAGCSQGPDGCLDPKAKIDFAPSCQHIQVNQNQQSLYQVNVTVGQRLAACIALYH